MPTLTTAGELPLSVKKRFPAVGFPTALAPMQDVTGLPFMNLVNDYGPPDLFFTEYFRVHSSARIDPVILSSITENASGKPVFAQLIGENVEHMARFAKELQQFPIAGIDLNLGCPAPRVYRKNVGGGLLREPAHIDRVLSTLREVCRCPLTVKTRIGFEDTDHFDRILKIFERNQVDLLSLHARTVKGGYRATPQYEFVKQAVNSLTCPVLLNGDVNTPQSAIRLVQKTGASGAMIGRSAIRNPWIFIQIKQLLSGQNMFQPSHGHVYQYIQDLYSVLSRENVEEHKQVARMKKFLNFIGLSVDIDGKFLYSIRRVKSRVDMDKVCKQFLLNEGRSERPVSLEPFSGLIARPSSEGPACQG